MVPGVGGVDFVIPVVFSEQVRVKRAPGVRVAIVEDTKAAGGLHDE